MDRQSETSGMRSISQVREEYIKFFYSKVTDKAIELLKASKGADSVAIKQAERIIASNETIKSIVKNEAQKQLMATHSSRDKIITAIILATATNIVAVVVATAMILTK